MPDQAVGMPGNFDPKRKWMLSDDGEKRCSGGGDNSKAEYVRVRFMACASDKRLKDFISVRQIPF